MLPNELNPQAQIKIALNHMIASMSLELLEWTRGNRTSNVQTQFDRTLLERAIEALKMIESNSADDRTIASFIKAMNASYKTMSPIAVAFMVSPWTPPSLDRAWTD